MQKVISGTRDGLLRRYRQARVFRLLLICSDFKRRRWCSGNNHVIAHAMRIDAFVIGQTLLGHFYIHNVAPQITKTRMDERCTTHSSKRRIASSLLSFVNTCSSISLVDILGSFRSRSVLVARSSSSPQGVKRHDRQACISFPVPLFPTLPALSSNKASFTPSLLLFHLCCDGC